MTTTKERTTEQTGSADQIDEIVVWDPDRAEADRELWAHAVDYNNRETERFTLSLLGGLEVRLRGIQGLDERDDPVGNDYMLSTLRSIVESMCGHLEVTAVFGALRLPADVSGGSRLWKREIDEATFQRLLEDDD